MLSEMGAFKLLCQYCLNVKKHIKSNVLFYTEIIYEKYKIIDQK